MQSQKFYLTINKAICKQSTDSDELHDWSSAAGALDPCLQSSYSPCFLSAIFKAYLALLWASASS